MGDLKRAMDIWLSLPPPPADCPTLPPGAHTFRRHIQHSPVEPCPWAVGWLFVDPEQAGPGHVRWYGPWLGTGMTLLGACLEAARRSGLRWGNDPLGGAP